MTLSPEESAIMLIAVEEGYLNEVITQYAGVLADDRIRALIPGFAAIVAGMIDRDLIEIREPMTFDWAAAPPLTSAEIAAVLADEHTWLRDIAEPTNNRMIMLMTTDHGDTVIGRRTR